MTHAAISVENLSKAYRLGARGEVHDTMVGALQGMLKAPWKNWRRLARLNTFRHQEEADDLFWALRDVSFEVEEGDVVGVVGRNGAGKSTLLKILSRITEPTRGRAVIRGRVSSLLEVGTGFHPELSGRDNIYMNGTILGMTKREIDKKFDEIVDFSGVEKFLDTPIKHYSSGMKVRLAFSVAANLEPEILIIDEVLAVGDAEFQKKCLGKMQDVAHGGRTVLFVSHNMASMDALCNTGLEFQAGRLVAQGGIGSVIADYRQCMIAGSAASAVVFPHAECIRMVSMYDGDGVSTSAVPIGRDVEIRMTFADSSSLQAPRLYVRVADVFGIDVLTVQTPSSVNSIDHIQGGKEVICRIHDLPLAPGEYVISTIVMKNRDVLERHRDCLRFTVVDAELFGEGRGFDRGSCVARSSWSIWKDELPRHSQQTNTASGSMA